MEFCREKLNLNLRKADHIMTYVHEVFVELPVGRPKLRKARGRAILSDSWQCNSISKLQLF